LYYRGKKVYVVVNAAGKPVRIESYKRSSQLDQKHKSKAEAK
jgi:hypothetical protein